MCTKNVRAFFGSCGLLVFEGVLYLATMYCIVQNYPGSQEQRMPKLDRTNIKWNITLNSCIVEELLGFKSLLRLLSILILVARGTNLELPCLRWSTFPGTAASPLEPFGCRTPGGELQSGASVVGANPTYVQRKLKAHRCKRR